MGNFNQGQGNIKMMEKIGNSEKENEFYKREVFKMLKKTENTKFIRQIWTIFKKHMEKGD